MIEFYYLVTPVFFALDYFWGANVRASAFTDPNTRYAYYAVLFGLGGLVHWKPKLAPIVGIAESSANVFLLVLAIMLPIWNATDAFIAGDPVGPVLSTNQLINVAIIGPMFIISFKQSEAALWKQLTKRR